MIIGIIVCHKLTHDCTGVGCFKALRERRDAFSTYDHVDIGAFFHCNGCDQPLFEGMAYKFDQLKRQGIDTLHMAKCIEVECDRYDQMAQVLSDKGFDVIKGSH